MQATKHTPLNTALLALALTLACGAAQAANFSKNVYNGAKDEIKAAYKADRESCDKLAGNTKDICVEQAKGDEKIAMAQLDYNYSGSTADEAKLYEARYEARYELAKERCDDFAGDAKSVCNREAQTERDKAKADVKMAKKVAAAVEDAETARLKADYKLAATKCDALAGEPKDICLASAKARYNERW